MKLNDAKKEILWEALDKILPDDSIIDDETFEMMADEILLFVEAKLNYYLEEEKDDKRVKLKQTK